MRAAVLSRLFPNPSFYGWRVLAVGLALAALSGPGQSYLLSLYIDPLTEALGVSRLDVSSVYGGATILAALTLPWVGGLADRLTSRQFAGIVLALLGGAVFGLSQVRGLWGLGLVFFCLRLLGQGAISLGITTLVVRWFLRFRGRAFALTSVGYAIGEAVFPAVAVALIAWVGWRGSLLGLSGAYVFLLAPLLAWALRPRHEATEPLDGSDEEGPSEASHLYTTEDWDPREALRSRAFGVLLLLSSASPFLLTGMIFHLPAVFRSMGWAAEATPRAFAAYAAGGMACTYGMGLLLERVHSKVGLGMGLGALALGLSTLFLPLGPAAGPWVFGAALGGSAGVSHAANGVLWPAYFGVRSLGALKGIVNAARNGSTALAPPIAAWLAGPEEAFGRFAWLCICLAVAFALVSLAVPRRLVRVGSADAPAKAEAGS